MTKKVLVWFRSDLRCFDNTALFKASESMGAVYAIFLATPQQWRLHDMAELRQRFIMRNVLALRERLEQRGIPFVYLDVGDFQAVPHRLAAFCSENDISAVFANREYGWNEKRRDENTENALASAGVGFRSFHDQGMLPPGLKTKAGKPYTVYTPFRRRWLEQWRSLRPTLYPEPARRPEPPPIAGDALAAVSSSLPDALWPAGEEEARVRLKDFCTNHLHNYSDQRDIPSLSGTSSLSPWLSAGVISPRECFHHAVMSNESSQAVGDDSAETWMSELIWRDFYIHILDSFPFVSCGKPFRPATSGVPWRHDKRDFTAWCEGDTGIPIVDAAMAQLNQTGWMHNRLRMIVAMFLTKHLLIDWRWGERYFMQKLVDGHLASNNGGWQWAASTGTDAAPYFRIFNPVTQSKKFDAGGDFIRRWLPTLEGLDNRSIHDPTPEQRLNLVPTYPPKIVDLAMGRHRALEAFGSARA